MAKSNTKHILQGLRMYRVLSIWKYLFNVGVFSSIFGVDVEVVYCNSTRRVSSTSTAAPHRRRLQEAREDHCHHRRMTTWHDRPWCLLHRHCELRVSRGFDCRYGREWEGDPCRRRCLHLTRQSEGGPHSLPFRATLRHGS